MNITLLFDDPECASNPEMFFPTSSGSRSIVERERAKAICAKCRHRTPCLAWALAHNETGIWGGTTYEERNRIKRSHRRSRLNRYELYRMTQDLIENEGLSLAQCAERIGKSYSWVCAQRQLARGDIDAGKWRP